MARSISKVTMARIPATAVCSQRPAFTTSSHCLHLIVTPQVCTADTRFTTSPSPLWPQAGGGKGADVPFPMPLLPPTSGSSQTSPDQPSPAQMATFINLLTAEGPKTELNALDLFSSANPRPIQHEAWGAPWFLCCTDIQHVLETPFFQGYQAQTCRCCRHAWSHTHTCAHTCTHMFIRAQDLVQSSRHSIEIGQSFWESPRFVCVFFNVRNDQGAATLYSCHRAFTASVVCSAHMGVVAHKLVFPPNLHGHTSESRMFSGGSLSARLSAASGWRWVWICVLTGKGKTAGG